MIEISEEAGGRQEKFHAENIQSNIEMKQYDIVGSVGIDSYSKEECDRQNYQSPLILTELFNIT